MAKDLPRFASEEEECEFWDTHSIMGYVEEVEEQPVFIVNIWPSSMHKRPRKQSQIISEQQMKDLYNTSGITGDGGDEIITDSIKGKEE